MLYIIYYYGRGEIEGVKIKPIKPIDVKSFIKDNMLTKDDYALLEGKLIKNFPVDY